MKIAVISASKIPSQTANSIQVMKACQGLVELGHDLILLVPKETVDDPDLSIDLARFYGIKSHFQVKWIKSNARLRKYDFALAAIRYAKGIEADIVYIWPLQAALLGLLWRMPVVLEMHGPPEGLLGPILFQLFTRFQGKRRILYITNALKNIVEDKFSHASAVPSMISPNGVDPDRYNALPDPVKSRQELGLPEQTTLIYSGHLYAGRGMSLLVKLAGKFPRLLFLWVGGTDRDVDFWRNQLELKAIENVKLVGFVPNSELPRYQAAGDIFLMPYERAIAGSSGGDSSPYASPMKMFEYMACGRPIISSDLPVIREVLNETNAMLCPPDDIESWSQAVDKLTNDKEFGKRLADQSKKDIKRFYWKVRAQNAVSGFLN